MPRMSDERETQDAPIMDGATDASDKEKQEGLEQQRRVDKQSDEAKHAHPNAAS